MGNSCASCCGDPELQFKHILYDIYPTREQFIIADTTAVSTSSISIPSLSDLFHQRSRNNNNSNHHHGTNTSRNNTDDDDDDSSRMANGDNDDEEEDLEAQRQGPSNTSRFIDDDDENENNDETQQRNDSILLKSLHLGDDEDEEDGRKDALNNSTTSNKKKKKRQSRQATKNRFGVDYNQFSLAELIQFVKRDPSKKMKLVLGKVVKVLEADCLSLTEHCPNLQMKNDSITSSTGHKEEPRKLDDENGTNDDADEGIIVQQEEEKENDKTTSVRKKTVVSIFTPEENQERLKKLANQLSCMAEEKERQKQEESLAKFAYAELTADAQYHFDRILVGSLILREFLEHDEKEMKLRLEQERNQENNNNNMIQSNRRRDRGSSSNRLKPLISSATIDLYVPIILQACETLIYKRSEPPLKIAGTELFAVLCRRLSDATTNSNNTLLMTPTLTSATKNLKNVSFMSTASAFSDRSDEESDDNKDEPKNGSFSILSPHQQASRRLDSTQTFSTLLLPASVTGNYHEVGRKLIMTSQQATTLPQLLRMTYIGLGTTSIDALHQRYAALIAIAEVAQCLGTWLPDPSETMLTLSESLFKWFSGAPSPNLVVSSSSSSSSSSSRSNIGKNKARREHEALKKALRLACDRFCDDKNDNNNNMEQEQQEEQNQRIEIGPLTLDSVIRDWCMLRVFLNAISAVSTSTTRQDVSEKIIDPLFDFLTENHLWWATGDKVLAIEKKRSEKKKLMLVDDKDRHAVESDFQFRGGDESHQANFNQEEQHEASGEDGDHQDSPSTFMTIPPFSWVLCRTLSSSLERQHQCGTLFLEKILERLVPMSSQRAKESKARIYERIGMINAVMEIIEVLPMIENEQQESSAIQLRIVDTVKKCLYSSAQKKKVMMMQHQPSSAAAMAASFLLKDPSSRTTSGSKNEENDDEEITAHLLERQQRVAVDCITSIATKTAIKRQWDVLSQIADSLLNELKSLILPTSSSSSSSYPSGEGKHMKELEEKRKREEEARRKRYENQYITRRYQQIQERDHRQQQQESNNSDIHSREFHAAQSPYSQIDMSPYEFTTRQQLYHNHLSSSSSSTPRSRAQQHLLPISASYHHDSVSQTPTSLNYYTPRNQLVSSKRASSPTPNVGATPQSSSRQNQIMAEMMAITTTPSITQNQRRQLPPLPSSNNLHHQQQRTVKTESPVVTRTSLTLPLWTVLTRIAPLLRYLPSAQRRKLNFIQRVSSFLTEHGEPLALRCLSHHLNGGGRQERTKMMSLPSSSQLVLCGFTSAVNTSNNDENEIEEEAEEDELFSNRAVESLYRHIPLIPLAQFEQVTILADGGNDRRQLNTETTTTTKAQEKFQKAVTAISAANAFSSSRSIMMKNNHNTPTLSTSQKSSSTSTTVSSLEFLEKYLFGELTLGKLEQDRQRRENTIQKLSSTATSARFSQYTVKKLREEEEEKSAINASPMFNSGISRNCGGALLTPIGIVSFVDFCKSYLNLRLKSKTTNKEVPVHFVSLILNFCEGFAKDEIEMQRREFKMMKQRMKELEMSPASRIKKTITTSKPPPTTPKKKKTRNILVKFAGLDDDKDNNDNDEEKEIQKEEKEKEEKEKEEKEKEDVEKLPEQTEPSTYQLSEFSMAWSLAGLALLFVLGSELQIPDLVDYSRELLKRRLQTDADYIKSSRQEQENKEKQEKNQALESAKKKLSSAVQKINVMSDLIASSAVLNPAANLEKSTSTNNRYGGSNQHQSPSSHSTSSRIVPPCFQSKYSALFQVQRHHHTENEKNANSNNNMMMKKKLAPHNSGFVVVSGHEFDILERKEKTVVVESVEDLHLINKNTLKAYLSQRYGERSVEENIV